MPDCSFLTAVGQSHGRQTSHALTNDTSYIGPGKRRRRQVRGAYRLSHILSTRSTTHFSTLLCGLQWSGHFHAQKSEKLLRSYWLYYMRYRIHLSIHLSFETSNSAPMFRQPLLLLQINRHVPFNATPEFRTVMGLM